MPAGGICIARSVQKAVLTRSRANLPYGEQQLKKLDFVTMAFPSPKRIALDQAWGRGARHGGLGDVETPQRVMMLAKNVETAAAKVA